MTSPLVSVIMNCFNGEQYLREAIDSVIAQTYQNWELIFYDNQSIDNSAEIFKTYNDKRLRYFYASNHTLLYEARNNAIQYASGQFFAFLDVDDWWDHLKLEKQIPLFENPKVGIVYGNYWFENQIKGTSFVKFSKPLPSGDILNQLLGHCVVGLVTIIVRRRTFETLKPPGFNNRFHIIGDFDLVIKTALDWDILCVNDPIGHYRWHGKNETVLNRELHINELDVWSSEAKSLLPVTAMEGIRKFNNSLMYQKAELYLQKKEYGNVWSCIKKLKSVELMKLILLIVLPNFLVQKIRSE